MKTIEIYIDEVMYSVRSDATILEAAMEAGVHIPSLCWLPDQDIKANCRICVVEVFGRPNLQPACATKVSQGISVHTKSPEVIRSRRTNLELLLSRHPMDCQHCARNAGNKPSVLSDEFCGYCVFCDCVQDGDCVLQDLATEYDVGLGDFDWVDRKLAIDDSLPSIIKDPAKCILCRRCVSSCDDTQGVCSWSVKGRGPDTQIVPASLDERLISSPCVQCGQCVKDCPTGALSARQEFMETVEVFDDRNTLMAAYIEPGFFSRFIKQKAFSGLSLTEENLAAGLYRAGFDAVFSGTEIQAEYARLLKQDLAERLSGGGSLPLIDASCFAARSYLERHYTELEKLLYRGKSMQALYGEYTARHAEGQNKRPFTVLLTDTISQKAEASNNNGTNLALTATEIKRLFNKRAADLSLLPSKPLGNTIDNSISLLPAVPGILKIETKIGGAACKIAVAQGLRYVDKLLSEVAGGNPENYDFIQLTAIPGEYPDWLSANFSMQS